MIEVVQYSQPATKSQVDYPGEWYHNGDSVVVSVAGILVIQQWCDQIHLGEWESVSLSPYIISIPVIGPLGSDRWLRRSATVHKTGHLIYLVIKVLFC